ncbi:hypothetical protein [Nonomuraea dietziae]
MKAELTEMLPFAPIVSLLTVPEPAEYAVLSPEREDYLRTQIAHR